MFAFDMSQLSSRMVLFAAEPSVWLWVVGALILWAVVFRRRRSRKTEGTCRKRRRGFPWRAAVLVILIVVAWKKFGSHSSWSVDWDLEDEIRSLQAATGMGGFLPIEKNDLWALRHEDTEKTRDDVKRRAARPVSKRSARESAATQARAEVSSSDANGDEEFAAQPATVAPHVARSVSQARELADRAVEQARAIAAKTAHNVAAIKALKALKFDEADGDVSNKKVAEKATDAPSTESVAAATPSAPDPPAASSEPPAAPAAPTDVALKPSVDSAVSQAVVLVAEAPQPPTLPAAAAPSTPERVVSSSTVASKIASALKKNEPQQPASQERPAWLDQPGGREGDVYYETVMVELYKTPAEAEDALAEELQTRTRAYVDRYLGAGASKLFTVPPAYIHDRLVRDRYKETVESPSFGPMINAYAQLAFDHRARAQLQRMQRDALIEHRLLEVAGGAAAVMLVLGAVFGYLKLDTLTRGYYTRRLQLAAGVVILTVAAGTFYVVRSKMHDVPSQESPASAPATAVRVLPIDAAQLPAS